MNDKIEEIRARHAHDNRDGDVVYPGAHRDRSFLLAEVDHQRAEIERLRAEIEALHEALRRGAKELFVVERSTTGPDTPVAFIMEGKP